MSITLYTEQGKKITANKVIATRYPLQQTKHIIHVSVQKEVYHCNISKEKYPRGMYINIEEPKVIKRL